MLKLTINDLLRDRIEIRFGDEAELLKYVQQRFWVPGATTLDEVVELMNEIGHHVVKVEPYEPPISRNILPRDYLTHSQADAEDPWPRAGDKKVI